MTNCDGCGIEGFMPYVVLYHTREKILQTYFCSEKCIISFFQEVINQ